MRSVRFRVTAIATLVVAALLAVTSVVILRLVERDLVAEAEDAVNETIVGLREDLGANALPDDSFLEVDTEFGTVLVGLVQEGDELIGELIDPETDDYLGELLLDPDTGEILDAFLEDDDVPVEDITPDVREVIASAVQLEGGDYIVAGFPLEGIRESINSLRHTLLITIPLLVLALALVVWWLVGWALRPVGAITDRAREITTATLHERVPQPNSGDEIAALARVVNDMLDRIEQGVTRQQQFVADASHELRTPLASIRAAAELGEASTDPQRARELTADVLAEVDRIDELVDDLLALARLEEDAHAGWEVFDLGQVVAEAASRGAGDLQVSIQADQAVAVRGRARHWERVVENLVGNAARHGAAAAVVSVESGTGLGRVVVTDDGPGIPEADRERVFERFTRLDEARPLGGFGLGLPIVRAIARSHGGDAYIETPRSGSGTRVVATIPLAEI